MDITRTAIKLQKEIEKLENKLKDGTARSYKQINEIRAKETDTWGSTKSCPCQVIKVQYVYSQGGPTKGKSHIQAHNLDGVFNEALNGNDPL